MARPLLWCTAATALTALTPAAPAQEKPDPATDPALNNPRVGERARDLERRPPQPALSPNRPQPPEQERGRAARAAAPVPDPRLAAVWAGPLRREGAFLERQQGSLLRMPSGEWLFVFHRDGRGRRERPMFLLPCRHLERMEQLAGADPEAPTFAVSGQVFQYRGANYLLLAAAPPLVTEPVADPTAPSPAPAPPDAAQRAGEAGLDATIRELEAHAQRPIGLAGVPSPDGRRAADAPAGRASGGPAPLPEGMMFIRRRGRLVRVAGSEGPQTALRLDSDADSATNLDPPLILSRCVTLERMEQIALAQGETMVFEVSGRVLAYNGRNHLVPMLYRVYPPTELERRQ